MRSLTTLSLCVATIIAVVAFSVSTASAEDIRWYVGGAVLSGGTAKEFAAINTTKTWKLSVANRVISCTGASFLATPKPHIFNPTANNVELGKGEGQIEYTGCGYVNVPNCTVKKAFGKGTLSELALSTDGSKIYDVLLPEKPENEEGKVKLKPITVIESEGTGAECTSVMTVEGTGIAAEISNTTMEESKHNFKFPAVECFAGTTPIKEVALWKNNLMGIKEKLKLEMKAFGGLVFAEMCGEAELKLVSNENWSAQAR